MKFIVIVFFIPLFAFCQTKDSLKYHFKVNVYPIDNQQYSGAFTIGLETRLKKINYGVDWFVFSSSFTNDNKYKYDTLMHRTRVDYFFTYTGFALNLSKSISIKKTYNKLIVGVQAIVGSNKIYSSIYNETFDSVRVKDLNGNFRTENRNMEWQNDENIAKGTYGYFSPKVNVSNANLTLGLAAFCRIELLVYKRFSFSPEFKFPVIYLNNNKFFNVDINPGLSFNLAYKFG